MMRIAVVDDTKSDSQVLTDYVSRFQKENNVDISLDVYDASIEFLETFFSQYDVVFLDIEMPGSDGLEVAHEIRKADNAIGIIFVTNMAQYAIRGYEVNAIDFIVKPVSYYLFSEKLNKAFEFYEARRQKQIVLNGKDGIHRLLVSDILYVEKDKDALVFHTSKETIYEYGSIRGLKEKLKGLPFEECSHGVLVNLEMVKFIGKDSVIVGKETLPMSRRMKKDFSRAYVAYIGGGLLS